MHKNSTEEADSSQCNAAAPGGSMLLLECRGEIQWSTDVSLRRNHGANDSALKYSARSGIPSTEMVDEMTETLDWVKVL